MFAISDQFDDDGGSLGPEWKQIGTFDLSDDELIGAPRVTVCDGYVLTPNDSAGSFDPFKDGKLIRQFPEGSVKADDILALRSDGLVTVNGNPI